MNTIKKLAILLSALALIGTVACEPEPDGTEAIMNLMMVTALAKGPSTTTTPTSDIADFQCGGFDYGNLNTISKTSGSHSDWMSAGYVAYYAINASSEATISVSMTSPADVDFFVGAVDSDMDITIADTIEDGTFNVGSVTETLIIPAGQRCLAVYADVCGGICNFMISMD